MGLTIHYTLRADAASPAEARALIEKLHARAKSLPFQHVTEVIEFEEELPDDWHERYDRLAGWLALNSGHALQLADEQWDLVAPLRAVGFVTRPGEGSEPASFALCLYPDTIEFNGRAVPTFLEGWRWQGHCKTQYASNPACGGMDNFLRCHLSIVQLLDAAGDLGMLGEVEDEGGYWKSRNAEQLAQQVGRCNRLVAGFVGAMRDTVENAGGDPRTLKSEITQYPDFEHLEADQRVKEEDQD